jgi:hypothetical protein
MTTIYFDESGQTGAHLFDRQQPCFGLASTDFDENEAKALIERCFPRQQGRELKSKNVLGSGAGRRAFLTFAREIGRSPERVCAAKIDKRFAVVSKMVDNLVEPMLHAQGYDFYADNYAARYANMAYFALTDILGTEASDPLLAAYNTFARSPEPETLSALTGVLAAAAEAPPHGCEVFLEQMLMGAELFEDFHDLSSFEDSNDLHVTAAVQTMAFWQSQHADEFDVVHDESVHFFARADRWQMMTNPDLPPMIIDVGDKRLTLPIRVRSTRSARSHESTSLQIADLIAGFVTRFSARADLSPEDRAFFDEALLNGLGEMSIYPVEAGRDFVGGPPPLADGPDAVDRIAAAVRWR